MPKFVKQIEINLRHLSEDDEVISKQVENGEGWSGKPDITLKTASIWDIITEHDQTYQAGHILCRGSHFFIRKLHSRPLRPGL